jgi:RNA polymerase sigma factor (sigma-70 family)
MVAEPAGDDHRLVAAVRRGDDRAFELLYSRYHRRIQAYVIGMVKDHGRAEDITQEVFVSALRRMRETERPIAFKPWIYEIAKNACIDQFRRSRRAEEISLEADEGLAPGDYGRLVGSDPTPDVALAAKQDLDHLCGAFGGLSETHHEILVLRELEGMSYREIGERMGMSRPAVESTLFRARRRLTEEYDDLVSGARCQRIHSLIQSAASSRIGTRESRRLSRHIAHCQPCRREAMAAGLDAAILTHVPLPKRAARKIAALLPFPLFGRARGDEGAALAGGGSSGSGWTTHIPILSDQVAHGWGKLATAAAVLAAGVGAAGVSTEVAGSDDTAPDRARPAQERSAAAPSRETAARVTQSARALGGAAERTAKESRRSNGAGARVDRRDAAGGDGSGSTGATPSAPASGGGAVDGGNTVAGGTGTRDLPEVTVPTAGSDPPAPVRETVEDVGETVQPAVEDVGQTAQPVVETVEETVEGVTAPVQETVEDVEQTVEGATGADLPLP